jgi:hypothetical protein
MISTIPKWTSALLRETNPSVHAMVFANHDGKKALRQVLEFLDANRDGMSTANEKERASIIIYGHSWGGLADSCSGSCAGGTAHSGAA